MALNIRDPEAGRLAAELAQETGETKTEAVTKALRERIKRGLADELEEIADHCASLPVLNGRRGEQILGYDEAGPDL